MFRKTLVSAVFAAASMGAVSTAATAETYTIIRVAPPAPVVETMPSPRRGQVWVPGYYDHRGNQYQWVQGHWVRERRGYDWQEARWIERNGEWRRVGGDWQRRGPDGDRDGDGVANRYDRDQNLRRNGDRDGDGVRNKNDRFPYNPRRS